MFPYGTGPGTKPLQAVASLSNATGTVWAAITGSKWTLDNIFVSIRDGVAGQEVVVLEDSVSVLRIPVQASQNTYSHYVGYTSSVTSTSLRMQAPADGTVTAVFVGHTGAK